VLNSIGVTILYQRRFAEALTCYQKALEIWRAIGDRADEGAGLGNLAFVNRSLLHNSLKGNIEHFNNSA
jgi:tetratricopeptide (TPR) repeat protein